MVKTFRYGDAMYNMKLGDLYISSTGYYSYWDGAGWRNLVSGRKISIKDDDYVWSAKKKEWQIHAQPCDIW
jgi:hypothetical protein